MTVEQLEQYCASLEMGKPFTEQVALLHKQSANLIHAEIKDIFISDHLTAEGKRQYRSLHFFSQSCVVEIEDFIARPTFWLKGISGIESLRINKENYEFGIQTSRDDASM